MNGLSFGDTSKNPVPLTPPRARELVKTSPVPGKSHTKRKQPKKNHDEAKLWKAISGIRMVHVEHCQCGTDLTELHKCDCDKIREAYVKIRNELVELHLQYANRIAAVLARTIPRHSLVDREDTQTAAAYAVIQAIDRYFPGSRSKASFQTFSYRRVRGEILDDTRRLQDMPCDIAALRRASYPVIEGLTHALGCFPTIDLIVEKLTEKDIADCTDPLIFSYVFNQSTYDADGTDITIDNNAVISQVRRSSASRGRNSSLSDFDVFSLIEDEMIRDIVWQYYRLGMSHKEIAMVGSYSLSYVSAQRTAGEKIIRDYFQTASNMRDAIYE
jgi:DNA-directed RNA polymerase specialized sigma subunit